MTPEFKPPALTSRAQRAAERVAERADTWRTARAMLASYTWGEPTAPEDVTALALFLAGDTTTD